MRDLIPKLSIVKGILYYIHQLYAGKLRFGCIVGSGIGGVEWFENVRYNTYFLILTIIS